MMIVKLLVRPVALFIWILIEIRLGVQKCIDLILV